MGSKKDSHLDECISHKRLSEELSIDVLRKCYHRAVEERIFYDIIEDPV